MRSTSRDKERTTLLVEFIEFWAGQHDITLSVHRDNFLRILAHEEMLAEDYIVEDAANAEDIADGMRFR